MRTIVLEAGEEFRFETFEEKVSVVLIEGVAEMFGAELCLNKEYFFKIGQNSIYTPFGASLKIKGETTFEYKSKNTNNMDELLSFHFKIEERRKIAKGKGEIGPVVFVIGRGRNTVTRILINYSVRMFGEPFYIDLDCKNEGLLFPGTINCKMFTDLIDPENMIETKGILSYFTGIKAVKENKAVYLRMVESLSNCVSKINKENPNSTGMFICVDRDMEDQLQELIEIFKPTDFLIIGDESLFSILSKNIKKEIRKSFICQSSGYLFRKKEFRKRREQRRIHEYFYGTKEKIVPFLIHEEKSKILLRDFVESKLAPSSALPIGAKRKLEETKVLCVEKKEKDVLYSVLGVSCAKKEEEDFLVDLNVFGYVFVSSISEENFIILSPSQKTVSEYFLISRDLKWMEDEKKEE